MFFCAAFFLSFFSFLEAESIYVGHAEFKAVSILEKGEKTSSFFSFDEHTPGKMLCREEANELYVLLENTSFVQVIDMEEKTLGKRLDFLQVVEDFFIQDSFLFGVHAEDLFAFDLASGTLSYKAPHGLKGPFCITVSEDGLFVFVGGKDGTLFVFDVEKNVGIHHHIDPQGHLGALSFLPGTTTLAILSSSYDHDLIFFDYVSKEAEIFPLITLIEGGDDLCISPDKEYLYILGSETSNVGKFHLASKSLEKLLPVGKMSLSMGITQDGSYLYIASQQEKKVLVILLSSFAYAEEVVFPYPCSTIFVEPLDPIERFVGEQSTSLFLSGERRTNIIHWTPKKGSSIDYYLLHKNGRLLRKISARGNTTFRDERIRKGEKVVYEVVAVSVFGTFSKKYRIEVG